MVASCQGSSEDGWHPQDFAQECQLGKLNIAPLAYASPEEGMRQAEPANWFSSHHTVEVLKVAS